MARNLQQDRFPARAWLSVKDRFAGLGLRASRGARKVGLCRLGATAIEFGIVAPLFLSMVLGMVEMGRAMWIKASMQYAVERAVRGYMVDNTISTTTLESDAQAYLQGVGVNLPANPFSASLDTSTAPDTMSITGTYNFQALIIPFPFPDVTFSVKSSVRKNS